jgi:hypothetical protein
MVPTSWISKPDTGSPSICLDYLGNGSTYTFVLNGTGWAGFNAYTGTIVATDYFLFVEMVTASTTRWYLTDTLGNISSPVDQTTTTESVFTTTDPPVGLTFDNGTTVANGSCP